MQHASQIPLINIQYMQQDNLHKCVNESVTLLYILIFRVDGFIHIYSEFLGITQFLILNLVKKKANIESNGTFQSNKAQNEHSAPLKPIYLWAKLRSNIMQLSSIDLWWKTTKSNMAFTSSLKIKAETIKIYTAAKENSSKNDFRTFFTPLTKHACTSMTSMVNNRSVNVMSCPSV